MFNYLKYFLFVSLFCASLQGQNYSYSDLLKECQPEQIKALQEVRSVLNWSEDAQFQSLEGGLTRAKVYSFEFEGKKHVLRFLALTPSHSKEMRQNEMRALNIGNKLGIAPECVLSDQNAVLMVMPFIQGHPLQHPDDNQLSQLGTMLRTLHNYSGSYPTRYSLKDRIMLHYQKGTKSGIAYPTGFDQEVQNVLGKTTSRMLVPSHGDLNPSNILVDDSGVINIIDWTTATLEDPFFDLSFFCLLSNLSPLKEEVFLEAYFGRKPSEKECEILREEKAKICLLTAAIWFRFSETLDEVALPFKSRITALDAELYSPALKSIQDYLREGIVVGLNTAPKSEVRSYALSFYRAYLESQRTDKSTYEMSNVKPDTSLFIGQCLGLIKLIINTDFDIIVKKIFNKCEFKMNNIVYYYLNQLWFLTLFLLVLAVPCWANGFETNPPYSEAKVGFSEIPFFDNFQEAQRSLLIWYPIDADTKVTQSSNPWDVFSVGIDAPLAQKQQKMPVIVISHGWSGHPHELSWLIRELVHVGFFVVGVQHRDIIDGKMHINHWMRAQDISIVLDHFSSSSVAISADLDKIGIAGFSLGGTTALWLAGGRTTKLDSVMPGPEYANLDNFKSINELLPDLNKEMISKDWKDPRIKAAFIMAPAWSWIFDKQSLQTITIPTYIIAGANDEVVSTSYNAEFFAKYIPNCFYQEIPGKAGHFIFSTTLSSQKRAIVDPSGKLGFLLDDDESVDRPLIQSQVASEAVHFFQKM